MTRRPRIFVVTGLATLFATFASGAVFAQSTMCKNGYPDWANRSLDPKGIHPALRCEPVVGRAQSSASAVATQSYAAAAKQQQKAKMAMIAEQRRLAAASQVQTAKPTALKLKPKPKPTPTVATDADNPDKQVVDAAPSGRCRHYLPSTGQVVEVPCS